MLAVLFRLIPQYNIRNINAITVNYFTCFALGSLLIGQQPIHLDNMAQDWFTYALFLSFCFIFFFNVNALTIQRVGMIITSIFQKLSLVFPVLVGVIFFGEKLSYFSKIAIPLTIVAIVLSNLPNRKAMATVNAMRRYWYLPLLVIFGSGLIEVCLFYVEQTGKTNGQGMDFTTSLFGFAGLWGMIFLVIKRQWRFNFNELVAGVLIGVPNFFTIYLIIRGLELGWKGAVLFPVNNVGTIFCTAMIALIVFKEKLSPANFAGLLLALISVLLFSL